MAEKRLYLGLCSYFTTSLTSIYQTAILVEGIVPNPVKTTSSKLDPYPTALRGVECFRYRIDDTLCALKRDLIF